MEGRDVAIYRGTSRFSSDIICTVRGDRVYKGDSSWSSDIICNIRGNRIYKNDSSWSSDIIFTIRDGKIYAGDSSWTSDILMNIRDGKIYSENSSWSSDIIANIRDGKVYDGGYQTLTAGPIPAIILVRDGSLIPHVPLAQRTDQIDWNAIELRPYRAAATKCTGLLFKPGDTKLQVVEQ